jgi:putative oxidoreductase
MKIFTTIVRVVFGLMYLISSLGYFFNLMPQQSLSGSAQTFVAGLFASVYLMPVVKIIELVCGIAFISNRFVALATIIIFPITFNIFFFHLFMAPEGIAIAALMLLSNLFLAFAQRSNYQPLLSLK